MPDHNDKMSRRMHYVMSEDKDKMKQIREIPPIKPDPRLDVFISGEKKAEKEEKEGVVSFKPIGFHDVYYCLLVNEPVISMYEKGNLVCEHCHTELPNENHIFVCHINKHKIKNAGKRNDKT